MSPLQRAPESQVQPLDDAASLPRRCVNHPDRETYIACGRCERPFCPDCLIQTPAGQRCYECAGVRRDYAQRNFARRLIQALGASAAGAAIAGLLGSILFVVFVAAATGGAVGQLLSPLVNRRSRQRVYLLGLLALIGGAFAGWLAVSLLRTMGTPVPLEIRLLLFAPAIFQNWLFWVFTAIAAGVGYQRVR
jgi:hypothetical protein